MAVKGEYGRVYNPPPVEYLPYQTNPYRFLGDHQSKLTAEAKRRQTTVDAPKPSAPAAADRRQSVKRPRVVHMLPICLSMNAILPHPSVGGMRNVCRPSQKEAMIVSDPPTDMIILCAGS